MAETSGELLGGRYRLLGERTSFPFGVWWEAEDEQGARALVLRLNPEVVDPAAKVQAAIAASLRIDSPHIVAWADGGVDQEGHGWLAAPMFGPWSLTEHVSRTGGIPPTDAAALMHQVARAVAAAEAAQVLHNTLASELVRIVPLAEGGYGVKLYGFGLSDLLPSYKPLRKQDAYLGVPDYMSPELCAGKTAEGASADIYALGIMMYEAVRGRPPFAPTFASASTTTTLKRHIFERPLPLHVRYANAPHIKSYETVCFKALAKTANRRQASVAELEQELEQLLVEEMHGQVVSLAKISGRGPTTSRRLRTQVIAQIPVDEPKVELKPSEPAVVGQPAEPTVVVQSVEPGAEGPSVESPERAGLEMAPESLAAVMSSTQRRGESTLVFAGLGPAVREMAVAARNSENEAEGTGEDEGEPAGAASGRGRGKRKKGRKGSSVSHSAATQQIGRPTKTGLVAAGAVARATPAVATKVAPTASESATGEKAATTPSATSDGSNARIRKKDDTTGVAATTGRRVEPLRAGDDQEQWFSQDAESGLKKGSRAWILLLLAAVVVVLLVIFLMTRQDDSKTEEAPLAPVGTQSRYQFSSEPQAGVAGGATAPGGGDGPSDTRKPAPAGATTPPTGLTAAAPPTAAATAPTAEDAKLEAPTPETTPPKVETPKPEVAQPKVETPQPKVETPRPEVTPTPTRRPRVTQPKVETPKPDQPKVETPKPDVTQPTLDSPPKTDPTGSPEDQFRAQAKHYMQLGLQAYKFENYKLAESYFKKAQEADPSNALAAQYLKKAQEKGAR